MLGSQSSQTQSGQSSQSLPLPRGWSASEMDGSSTTIVYKKEEKPKESVASKVVDPKHVAEVAATLAVPMVSGMKVYKRAETDTLVFHLEFGEPHSVVDELWKQLKHLQVEEPNEKAIITPYFVEFSRTERAEYAPGKYTPETSAFIIQAGLANRLLLTKIFTFFVEKRILTDQEAQYFLTVARKPTLQTTAELLRAKSMAFQARQHDEAVQLAIEMEDANEKLNKLIECSFRETSALMELANGLRMLAPLKAFRVFKVAHLFLEGFYQYPDADTFNERLKIACDLSTVLLQRKAATETDFSQLLTLFMELIESSRASSNLQHRYLPFHKLCDLLQALSGFEGFGELAQSGISSKISTNRDNVNAGCASLIIIMAFILHYQGRLLQNSGDLKKGSDYPAEIKKKVSLILMFGYKAAGDKGSEMKSRVKEIEEILHNSKGWDAYQVALPLVELLAGFDPLTRKIFRSGFSIQDRNGISEMFVQMAKMICSQGEKIQALLGTDKSKNLLPAFSAAIRSDSAVRGLDEEEPSDNRKAPEPLKK